MEIILEWTEEDIDHIRKHNVGPKEVESIFESKIFKRKKGGKLQLLGKTFGGRILFVVIERIARGSFRVVSARDAITSEKDLYVKRAK